MDLPFDLNANTLFAGLIWGSIGTFFFMYGWKQKSTIPIGGGIAMVAVSYFVSSALYMSLASVAVLVVMYVLKKRGE